MFRKSITHLLNSAGYELIRRSRNQIKMDRASEAEVSAMIEVVRKNTMVHRAGLVSLYQQAVFCESHGLAGDYVECGVWKGGAVGLMALVNLKHGSARRHLHLFDSFEEICEPDENVDGERAIKEVGAWSRGAGTKGRLVPLKGIYDHLGGPGTLEENGRLLQETIGYDPQFIHFHKGWFQQTLPAEKDTVGKIAILRIDADWYASTRICLEELFSKVASGGFVIIDDYGTYDGCKKAVDEFVKSTGKPLFLNYVDKTIRYMIAP